MAKKIDITNPFENSDLHDASASVFGWEFQINAAIFLFLKYLDLVENIKVESKYQDIELVLKDKSHIYAQAKSVQNGSNKNSLKKLSDALFSLAKVPIESNDKLLYISNYIAPILKDDVFKNQIVALKNVEDEKQELQKIINTLVQKLEQYIADASTKQLSKSKIRAYTEVKQKLINMDADNFLVCSINPYYNTEQPEDKYQAIREEIQKTLNVTFDIRSNNILRYVSNILSNWQKSFLMHATIPDNGLSKILTKLELMLQIIAIISDNDCEKVINLLGYEIADDMIDNYNFIYNKKYFYHDRFDFINKLYQDFKEYCSHNNANIDDFIRNQWKCYVDEYLEFKNYDEQAQEYLIKRDLLRLLSSRTNINKIMERGK